MIGNKTLGFNFINNLFGFKPGDLFNKEKINEKIKYMYGLGYFNVLTYTVTPVKENYIHLNLYVEEKPSRKLRIGFRYDDAYKLVGIIGLQGTNVLFAGLRAEAFLQFAGLVKFDYNLSYPSRTLNLPIIPYINVSYKNIPIDLYHYKTGDRISEYDDKSWSFSGGIGFNILESGILKFEYVDEFIDVNPSILGTNENFPSWNTELNMLRSEFIMDGLDDPILPTRGFKINAEYTRSMKSLNSDLYFWHYQMDFKYYLPAANHHNLGFIGYYTNSSEDFPAYKQNHNYSLQEFL